MRATKRGKSYRVRIYDYTDPSGKQHMKSFSAPTKKEAEQKALDYINGVRPVTTTLDVAIKGFMENTSNIHSPSSIRGYTSIVNVLNKDYQWFLQYALSDIDKKVMQKFINQLSKDKSPKTVRNYYTFVCSASKFCNVNLKFDVILPEKVHPDIYIPTDEEIKELLDRVRGTELEIPIYLACFVPMRRGEICALKTSNIHENVIHVKESMVRDKTRKWVVKQPKTYAGDRYVEVPSFVTDAIRKKGYVTNLNPDMLTQRFERLIAHFDFTCRFHDLRHYGASILHAMGVPDAYIKERGGWSSDTFQKVYRHTIDDSKRKMNDKVNNYFDRFNSTED